MSIAYDQAFILPVNLILTNTKGAYCYNYTREPITPGVEIMAGMRVARRTTTNTQIAADRMVPKWLGPELTGPEVAMSRSALYPASWVPLALALALAAW